MKTTKVKCCKETIYGLTFGKIYDVIEENFMLFKILDDNNKTAWIAKDKFWNANNGKRCKNCNRLLYVQTGDIKQIRTSDKISYNIIHGKIVITCKCGVINRF